MPLKILKGSDPLEVKQLVACIYAQPGIGKSSLAFSSEAPLLLDFDGGSYRAFARKDTVQVSSWADVKAIDAEDLKPYKTLVFDTAGRALDWLTADIIGKNPKMGRGAGALTLPGFGELKSQFIAYTKLVRTLGLDIVLVVHSDEQRSGDEVIERLDVTGGSKNEIYKSADLMGRILVRNGKRVLTFNPTDTAFGKNPAQLPEFEIPDFARNPSASASFFAEILKQVKTSLNKQTATQQKIAAELALWQGKFDAIAQLEDFNLMIGEVSKKASAEVRDNAGRLLTKAAKVRGFEYSKEAGKYVKAAAKVAA
jgi:hypothetical protein